MKILKIILLVVFTIWLILCTSYSCVKVFKSPISYIVSCLSGALIGNYFIVLFEKVLE